MSLCQQQHLLGENGDPESTLSDKIPIRLARATISAEESSPWHVKRVEDHLPDLLEPSDDSSDSSGTAAQVSKVETVVDASAPAYQADTSMLDAQCGGKPSACTIAILRFYCQHSSTLRAGCDHEFCPPPAPVCTAKLTYIGQCRLCLDERWTSLADPDWVERMAKWLGTRRVDDRDVSRDQSQAVRVYQDSQEQRQNLSRAIECAKQVAQAAHMLFLHPDDLEASCEMYYLFRTLPSVCQGLRIEYPPCPDAQTINWRMLAYEDESSVQGGDKDVVRHENIEYKSQGSTSILTD